MRGNVGKFRVVKDRPYREGLIRSKAIGKPQTSHELVHRVLNGLLRDALLLPHFLPRGFQPMLQVIKIMSRDEPGSLVCRADQRLLLRLDKDFQVRHGVRLLRYFRQNEGVDISGGRNQV